MFKSLLRLKLSNYQKKKKIDNLGSQINQAFLFETLCTTPISLLLMDLRFFFYGLIDFFLLIMIELHYLKHKISINSMRIIPTSS